jgi:hypothetical protein
MSNTTTTQKCIIKINECPTLSGQEILTYHIGCNDNKDIYFRVVANSGNGFFNKDWLALSNIQQALWSLLKGKSSNTSAFILAALKHEGIVATLKGKRRNHEYIEPVEFIAEMDELIDSGVNLEPDAAGNKKYSTTKTTSKRTKKSS